MNFTDIFFNNGQLNWDAINTISNIILVFVLVSITGWYAIEVKKQTNLIVIGQKRNKILEEVQDVLTPVIECLNREIEAIQNHTVFWHRYTSGVCGFNNGLTRFFYNEHSESVISVFAKESTGVLREVLIKFSELKSKFHSHDSLIDELSGLYEEIEKDVKTTELKEQLEKITQEFNEKRHDSNKMKGTFIEKPDLFFGEYIINIEYTIQRTPHAINHNIDSIEHHIDFWEENQKELLKFRDTPHITEISKQIRSKLIQLRELDETIFEKVETIRDNYRKKYNFTDNEVDPFKGYF